MWHKEKNPLELYLVNVISLISSRKTLNKIKEYHWFVFNFVVILSIVVMNFTVTTFVKNEESISMGWAISLDLRHRVPYRYKIVGLKNSRPNF